MSVQQHSGGVQYYIFTLLFITVLSCCVNSFSVFQHFLYHSSLILANLHFLILHQNWVVCWTYSILYLTVCSSMLNHMQVKKKKNGWNKGLTSLWVIIVCSAFLRDSLGGGVGRGMPSCRRCPCCPHVVKYWCSKSIFWKSWILIFNMLSFGTVKSHKRKLHSVS